MKLRHGLHLTYCTNVHRGETWAETFATLQTHTLAVRERVASRAPFGIGLRLSARAARELEDGQTRRAFQRWLETHDAYVFTLNGFPYGPFHGAPVKEAVYRPDWTAPERLDYTKRLCNLLAELLPPDADGSISTLPGSFKAFAPDAAAQRRIRDHLWQCVEHLARLSERTGRRLWLALEPEPLCLLETSLETVAFYERLHDEHPNDARLNEYLRVCYDTCHFAVEFESPAEVLKRFRAHGVRLGKIQLSNALQLRPTPRARTALGGFADAVYLHQVIARRADGSLVRYRDLPEALATGPDENLPTDLAFSPTVSSGKATAEPPNGDVEWRVHFHVPLHHPPTANFGNTAAHLEGVLDALEADPTLCAHLEIETYTWDVLPPDLKAADVTDQIVAEYEWALARLRQRGLASE
jgi:sugar phosphate isomerase/epimerase